MGAWGHGSFENDSALDWLADLEEGTASVRAALEEAIDGGSEYLDADVGTSALAAAELVAAWRGRERDCLPDRAREWLDRSTMQIEAGDVALAVRTIAIVLDADRSELAQLWDESGDNEWRAEVGVLLQRLGVA